MAKNWRRSCRSDGLSTVEDCGEQPSELFLDTPGGGNLNLFWSWPFGAAGGEIEEEQASDPDVWVVVDLGVVLADESFVWTSSFTPGAIVRARIRRTGSSSGCWVVSEPVELA